MTVINGSKGAHRNGTSECAKWMARPPSAGAPLKFTREDESTTSRFSIVAPATVTAGDVEITAEVSGEGGAAFATGYQVIEYPHIQRRHKLIPAVSRVKVVGVKLPPSGARLSVGYIMGVGDQVPAGLQQLGARVTLIDTDELAWGDLSKYDVIVTGVRAYERRADLRANNHRLLKYVEDGGTAIVQYNHRVQLAHGPYWWSEPDRITDENAPAKVLEPKHPIFNFPNHCDSDWQVGRTRPTFGERSGDVDPIEMEDPFEFNKGAEGRRPDRGALRQGTLVYGAGLRRCRRERPAPIACSPTDRRRSSR